MKRPAAKGTKGATVMKTAAVMKGMKGKIGMKGMTMKPMKIMKETKSTKACMKAMKAMKASPISRHFDRSGEANQVSLKLGSKSGKQQLPESSSTSKSCNLVCFVDETSNTVFALLTLFASLSFEPGVQITRMLRLHCWNILLGICVGLTVLTSCFCGFDLTCFLLLPFRDGSLCLLESLLIVLLNLAAQWVCLLALVCVAVMHVPSKLTVCRRSHVVVVRKSLWPDLLGGTGLEEIGSKSWLDNILQGLNARQLKPPMQQVRMLAQDEATLRRLQKSESLKHQLDIICGAAYKAKLSWKKIDQIDPVSSSLSTAAPAAPPPLPEVQTWRLRARDWKVVKPAATDGDAVSGERHDVELSGVATEGSSTNI